MVKFAFVVIQRVTVELDDSKFTPEFMSEFREGFFPFYAIGQHAEHLAQLAARGVIDGEDGSEFVEGYGPLREMGITVRSDLLEVDAA